MGLEDMQIVAGVISTLMFVSSNLPMLWKAFTTKNLTSYSLGHISLSNVGNLIYWLYLFTLPMGPVWFLHGFNTVVAGHYPDMLISLRIAVIMPQFFRQNDPLILLNS